MQARNPANTVHMGGDAMGSAAPTGRRSCARATYAATRPMEDFADSTSWRRASRPWTRRAGSSVEPEDTPLDSRHLDMIFALQTFTDKIYMGNVVSGVNARDTLAMTEILFGA